MDTLHSEVWGDSRLTQGMADGTLGYSLSSPGSLHRFLLLSMTLLAQKQNTKKIKYAKFIDRHYRDTYLL